MQAQAPRAQIRLRWPPSRTSGRPLSVPRWVTEALQQKLLDDALVEPGNDLDSFDRPRRVWNAVNQWVFVGVSSNEQVPAYNCYPEIPATLLVDELARRAARSIDDVLSGEESDGAI
jgi:hypothetical protein